MDCNFPKKSVNYEKTHRTLTSMIKFSKKTHWSYNYQVISKERINVFYKTNWNGK